MDHKKRKEVIIFLATLAVIATVFIVGIFYLKAKTTVASVATVVTPSSTISEVATGTPAVASTSIALTSSTPNTASSTSAVAPTKDTGNPSPPVVAIATTTASVAPVPPPPQAPPAASSSATVLPAAVALPYSIGTFGNQFSDTDNWSQWWWGSVSQSNGVLTVGANATSTSGGDILVGSNNWTDYTFQAILDWNSGETFGLMGRYVDDQNFLQCEYSEQTVGTVQLSFEQFVNGTETILATGNVQNYNQAGGANINAAMQVDGNEGSCAFNGQAISTYVAGNAIQAPLTGGIGFVDWDPNMNNSQITVKSIGVSTDMYNLGPNTIQGVYE